MLISPTSCAVITIDGPAGVGKTSLARRLASCLQIAYLDTGAMFRCLALQLGVGAEYEPEERLQERCAQWAFHLVGVGEKTELYCNDHPIGDEVRTEEVGMLASKIAALPAVRHILCEHQRALAQQSSLVVEGRDMGTVVFPSAQVKFFLDARPEVRAQRRFHDLQQRGKHVDLATLTRQIQERDYLDRHRAVAPLRPAEDAILLDTSDYAIDKVLTMLLEHVKEKKHG